jgi:hypothetical protein
VADDEVEVGEGADATGDVRLPVDFDRLEVARYGARGEHRVRHRGGGVPVEDDANAVREPDRAHPQRTLRRRVEQRTEHAAGLVDRAVTRR